MMCMFIINPDIFFSITHMPGFVPSQALHFHKGFEKIRADFSRIYKPNCIYGSCKRIWTTFD